MFNTQRLKRVSSLSKKIWNDRQYGAKDTDTTMVVAGGEIKMDGERHQASRTRRADVAQHCKDSLEAGARGEPADFARYRNSELRPARAVGCVTTKEIQWTKIASRARPSRPKGKLKEVAGKALGDSKLEAEGKGDQVKGKVQNAVGGIKDILRGK